jgi:GNAT superfamily N-acetyltransferase
MEITYREADASDVTTTRVVVATKERIVIGFATWDDDTKTLELVRVREKYQRQGHGTELVRRADEIAGCLLKDTGDRSPEGTKFLKSLGRPLARIKSRINPISCGMTMMMLLQDRHISGELDLK